MRTKKLNNKGFTLVEVIVVAVIVAVLALVAIQLYTGYIEEARRNTAENLAGSASNFLQSVVNSGVLETAIANFTGTNTGGTTGLTWSATLPGSNVVSFTIPPNAVVTVSGGVVTASVNGEGTIGVYRYKIQ